MENGKTGFIVESGDGRFLSRGFHWMHREPTEAFVFPEGRLEAIERRSLELSTPPAFIRSAKYFSETDQTIVTGQRQPFIA